VILPLWDCLYQLRATTLMRLNRSDWLYCQDIMYESKRVGRQTDDEILRTIAGHNSSPHEHFVLR